MSVTIGGRIVSPALPAVDQSAPTIVEKSFNKRLLNYASNYVLLESTLGIQLRERILDNIRSLCREWIRYVCIRNGMPLDVIKSSGGQLFTSGSYRLGVHEPGADIDAILIAPNICVRSDFFGSYNNQDVGYKEAENSANPPKDPLSLAERIRTHPDVTNFHPVQNASVPILTFDWKGVNIDLLFARLNSPTVPESLDINNDAILDGVDSATEKSLNGPRVTNLIAALVSSSPEKYNTFLIVVRCVRKWAKASGIYSNKMGYWGGVNINIAVALVVQLYPNACSASVLRKFFFVFKNWRWPNPVMLTKPYDANLGLNVWNSFHVYSMRQVAPMITPAYPAMNSSASVSRQTLQVMHEEFCRGHEVIDRLWKKHQSVYSNNASSNAIDERFHSGADFEELFRPSDFFINYPEYLSLCIVAPTLSGLQCWAGFVESRLRKLVSELLGKSLPLRKIQLWPKQINTCIVHSSALLTSAQRQNSITYFIGYRVDSTRMRGSQLDLERQLQLFRNTELRKYHPLENGMDLLPTSFACKRLPKLCFIGSYSPIFLTPSITLHLKEKNECIPAPIIEHPKVVAMKKRRLLKKNSDGYNSKQEYKERLYKLEKNIQDIKTTEAIIIKPALATKKELDSEILKKNLNTINARVTNRKDLSELLPNMKDIGSGNIEEKGMLLESVLDTTQNEIGESLKTLEHTKINQKRLQSDEYRSYKNINNTGKILDMCLNSNYKLDNFVDSTGPYDQSCVYGLSETRSLIFKRAGYIVKKRSKWLKIGCHTILPWRDPELILKPVSDVGYSFDTKTTSSNNCSVLNQRETCSLYHEQTGFTIQFKSIFDIKYLDCDGCVINQGDENYQPSQEWNGRRIGFEFKLSARGLGYYRTGIPVVIPSKAAYY